MSRDRNQPVQEVKARRDAALSRLTQAVPYMQFMGISFDRRGNELTAVMKYSDHLIGNPLLQALHGGAIGGFLESSALVELMWSQVWDQMEAGGPQAEAIEAGDFPEWPKVLDITVEYLRSGLPRDAYARATVSRSGRRYASVRVEAWQDDKTRPFAEAMVHFVMPRAR